MNRKVIAQWPNDDPRAFISPDDFYNYAPVNYLQIPLTRYSGGAFLNYDLRNATPQGTIFSPRIDYGGRAITWIVRRTIEVRRYLRHLVERRLERRLARE